jgi:sugar O-acyltransferase (sialic acid O-acetyltransferase NeuD family)
MTRPVIFVAASGLAREALEAVRAIGGYEPIGFVDDNAALWGELIDGVKVIGSPDVVRDHPDAAVLLCAGKGGTRESLAARLDCDDSRYATVIHPSVSIPRSCTVGLGTIVMAGCVLTASVTVGQHALLMPNVTLTHDDKVADFATLCAGVTLGGSAEVGERAYLGMNASVRERRRVGMDAVIGMGTVVLNNIPDGETWVGVPARRLSGIRSGYNMVSPGIYGGNGGDRNG